MKKTILAALLLAFSISAHAEWYEGGSLHQENGLAWQQASYDNKLATAGDLIAAAYQRDMLTADISSRINGLEDIKVLAEELVSQLDDAFEPQPNASENRKLFANQKVNETSAILLVMMGWVNVN